MRDFFGHIVCDCRSLGLVELAYTTPDSAMRVTELLVICSNCGVAGYELADSWFDEAVETGTANTPTVEAGTHRTRLGY